MSRNILGFLCLCAFLTLSFCASVPENADVKYYCGRCCGYDIYCNKVKNPFVVQDQSSARAPGDLVKLEGKDDAMAKYYCFTCCGYDWYCN